MSADSGTIAVEQLGDTGDAAACTLGESDFFKGGLELGVLMMNVDMRRPSADKPGLLGLLRLLGLCNVTKPVALSSAA